jgi:hypothetical protein
MVSETDDFGGTAMYRPRTHLETHDVHQPHERGDADPWLRAEVGRRETREADRLPPELRVFAGYCEEGPMPLYHREATLDSIWESLGKVICLGSSSLAKTR